VALDFNLWLMPLPWLTKAIAVPALHKLTRAQVIHFMRHGITEMNMHLAYHDHEDPDFEDPLM
jgi:hypothetical protein